MGAPRRSWHHPKRDRDDGRRVRRRLRRWQRQARRIATGAALARAPRLPGVAVRLLALVWAFLLAGVDPAAAEPISAAIIGAFGLTGLAASAATIAVPLVATVGISLGLSALSKAMA